MWYDKYSWSKKITSSPRDFSKKIQDKLNSSSSNKKAFNSLNTFMVSIVPFSQMCLSPWKDLNKDHLYENHFPYIKKSTQCQSCSEFSNINMDELAKFCNISSKPLITLGTNNDNNYHLDNNLHNELMKCLLSSTTSNHIHYPSYFFCCNRSFVTLSLKDTYIDCEPLNEEKMDAFLEHLEKSNVFIMFPDESMFNKNSVIINLQSFCCSINSLRFIGSLSEEQKKHSTNYPYYYWIIDPFISIKSLNSYPKASFQYWYLCNVFNIPINSYSKITRKDWNKYMLNYSKILSNKKHTSLSNGFDCINKINKKNIL
jgi:hypothetical protein